MASSLDNTFLLKDEITRLESFQNWPISHIVTPTSLASAGFYYIQESDHARCAYCNIIIGRWEAGDNPDKEHVRHHSSCPFVQTVILPRLTHLGGEEYSNTNSNTTFDLVHNLKELGINVYEGPKESNYTSVASRLSSFSNWPKHLVQTPSMLADAGFYYNGVTDHVYCFSCGGGICNWEPEDDPWTEHAKWYPRCNYLLLVKGASFAENVAKNMQITLGETDSHSGNDQDQLHNSNNLTRKNKSLEEENRLLKEARLCKICMDNESSIIFLPCRHLIVCEKCAPTLKNCPVCRSFIKAIVKAYFS